MSGPPDCGHTVRENVAANLCSLCLQAEIDRLRALNAELLAALRPFANAVYNDNGDMTITPCGIDEYAKAYFVMKRSAKAEEP